MENITLTSLVQMAYPFVLKIAAALAILIIGRIVIGIIVSVIRGVFSRSNTDSTLAKFVLSLTKIALLALLFIVTLGALGIQTASFVAVIGAAGLAVGFALQGSLSNFASGVMLITFRPFKTGDYIVAGGSAGVVDSIQIFSTHLNTPDNVKVIVPNSAIMSSTIENYSANDKRRVDMVFGIGYGDDIKKAKNVLERLVAEDSRVLKEPAPAVAVAELADSSVNFVVRPWVATGDYWGFKFDFTRAVKEAFDAEGISIPFPQQDVHMHQVNAA